MFAHLDSPANTQGFSPYLSGDEDLAVNFREELFRIAGSHSKRLVGVSWWSDISRSNGKEKSIPLSALADLARIPDLTLIDLQYGNTQAEREEFSRLTGKELVSLPFDKKNDLESLTALIQACDCIVTISNVTAHLAGAMGKEGYVLLPAGKGLFWYWQRKVSRSAWYPTLQLIRQQNLGSWEDVVLKLVQELKSNDRCGSVSEDA
jgi:ADP-heptose:LPS heptosyltransferase